MRALVETALTSRSPTAPDRRRCAARPRRRPHPPRMAGPLGDGRTPSSFRFKGYERASTSRACWATTRACRTTAGALGTRHRLLQQLPGRYVVVPAPRAYVVPQAWREAIERLQWNGVRMSASTRPRTGATCAYYHVDSVARARTPTKATCSTTTCSSKSAERTVQVRAGDYMVPLDQDRRALRGRDARAAGPRQLLPLGLLQQRAGKEGSLFGLCVRGRPRWSCWRPSRGCAPRSSNGRRTIRRCWTTRAPCSTSSTRAVRGTPSRNGGAIRCAPN
jgi:hypothetical protein